MYSQGDKANVKTSFVYDTHSTRVMIPLESLNCAICLMAYIECTGILEKNCYHPNESLYN